jgi:serine/threonine-protein kinase
MVEQPARQDPASEVPARRQPERIGKYQLNRFLGGGMSHVYQATDTVLGRRVALKLLTEAALADPEAKGRFLQEARLASAIQHENVIAIYDFGEEQGRPYLVMEYVEGESLRAAIEGGRVGDMGERLRIARQAAQALDCIHARKVVHRDVKPENIHIDRTGKVRLMDFGIAGATGADTAKPGDTAGTPFYMAPEQVVGRPLTVQADIYSFGVVLYELFTGQKLFRGDSVEAVFERILYQAVDPQPLISAGTPKAVIDVILRCTAKKLAERPESLAPVVEVLNAAARVEPAAPRKPDPAEPGRLSPSAQRPESAVRLKMPPPPAPGAVRKQARTRRPIPGALPIVLLTALGAAVVALVLFLASGR